MKLGGIVEMNVEHMNKEFRTDEVIHEQRVKSEI